MVATRSSDRPKQTRLISVNYSSGIVRPRRNSLPAVPELQQATLATFVTPNSKASKSKSLLNRAAKSEPPKKKRKPNRPILEVKDTFDLGDEENKSVPRNTDEEEDDKADTENEDEGSYQLSRLKRSGRASTGSTLKSKSKEVKMKTKKTGLKKSDTEDNTLTQLWDQRTIMDTDGEEDDDEIFQRVEKVTQPKKRGRRNSTNFEEQEEGEQEEEEEEKKKEKEEVVAADMNTLTQAYGFRRLPSGMLDEEELEDDDNDHQTKESEDFAEHGVLAVNIERANGSLNEHGKALANVPSTPTRNRPLEIPSSYTPPVTPLSPFDSAAVANEKAIMQDLVENPPKSLREKMAENLMPPPTSRLSRNSTKKSRFVIVNRPLGRRSFQDNSFANGAPSLEADQAELIGTLNESRMITGIRLEDKQNLGNMCTARNAKQSEGKRACELSSAADEISVLDVLEITENGDDKKHAVPLTVPKASPDIENIILQDSDTASEPRIRQKPVRQDTVQDSQEDSQEFDLLIPVLDTISGPPHFPADNTEISAELDTVLANANEPQELLLNLEHHIPSAPISAEQSTPLSEVVEQHWSPSQREGTRYVALDLEDTQIAFPDIETYEEDLDEDLTRQSEESITKATARNEPAFTNNTQGVNPANDDRNHRNELALANRSTMESGVQDSLQTNTQDTTSGLRETQLLFESSRHLKNDTGSSPSDVKYEAESRSLSQEAETPSATAIYDAVTESQDMIPRVIGGKWSSIQVERSFGDEYSYPVADESYIQVLSSQPEFDTTRQSALRPSETQTQYLRQQSLNNSMPQYEYNEEDPEALPWIRARPIIGAETQNLASFPVPNSNEPFTQLYTSSPPASDVVLASTTARYVKEDLVAWKLKNFGPTQVVPTISQLLPSSMLVDSVPIGDDGYSVEGEEEEEQEEEEENL